jgi:hypothetical protein
MNKIMKDLRGHCFAATLILVPLCAFSGLVFEFRVSGALREGGIRRSARSYSGLVGRASCSAQTSLAPSNVSTGSPLPMASSERWTASRETNLQTSLSATRAPK